jgi:cysteine-rich CWC protein
VQKLCSKCGLAIECATPAPDCWCQTVAAWEGVRRMVREEYADCLCQTCFSLAFYSPSTLKNMWGLPT